MTIRIIMVLIIGILSGMFIFPNDTYSYTGLLLDIGLCLLLFFVGMDIGNNKKAFEHIKKLGFKILLVPISVTVGSIVGGIIAGLLFGIRLNEGAAVGAGLGWYSLAPIIIAPYSSELSAVAFLTNVFREVFAIISIPLIAKKIGFLETIAVSGATAMDTTLPIVTKNTSEEVAVISFISGLLMSIFVPILVPIFIAM